MAEDPPKKALDQSGIIRIIIVASIIIIGAMFFVYEVHEKPSYIDKLFDPVSVFTLALVVSTALLWNATERLAHRADAQSEDMKASIGEAARAATAMESVAKHLGVNAEQIVESVRLSRAMAETQREYGMMQLRPYLSVVATDATFQERHRDFAFEGRGVIVVNGQTPARKVTYWARADILSVPLPDDFDFSPPEKDRMVDYASVVGPNNPLRINAMLLAPGPQDWFRPIKLFVEDSEVDAIKQGKTRALYMWGVVSYEDNFGARHETKFCYWYVWLRGAQGDKINPFYTARHNSAD